MTQIATVTVFDTAQLRADIVRTFGEYGAHIQVFDDLVSRIALYERQAQGVPLIAVQAIEVLNREIYADVVSLGDSMLDKLERKEIGKDIKRKQAAVSVLSGQRGELLRMGNQWRIKSERTDEYYITLWDLRGRLGSCNCQAGANGLMCKHQEAARALEIAREVKA